MFSVGTLASWTPGPYADRLFSPDPIRAHATKHTHVSRLFAILAATLLCAFAAPQDYVASTLCRPWSKTSDYWAVYWDVTRSVKERFDAEGISIPFPQQDVYMHQVEATS